MSREGWGRGERGMHFFEASDKHAVGVLLLYSDDRAPGHAHPGRMAVMLSGEAIQHLGQEAALWLNAELHRLGFHATRCDSRIDLYGDGITLIDDVLAACEAGELCRLRTHALRTDKTRGRLKKHGVNLGTREGSGRYIRIYDKGLEQGDRGPGQWVRIELEATESIGRQLGADLAGCVPCERRAKLAGAILGAVDFRERKAGETALARRPRVGWWQQLCWLARRCVYRSERTKTSGARRVGWLRSTVLPQIQAIADATGYELGQALDMLCGQVVPAAEPMKDPASHELILWIRNEPEYRDTGPLVPG